MHMKLLYAYYFMRFYIVTNVERYGREILSAECKTRIYCSPYVTLLGADDVFDDLFVEVGEHAL